MSQPPSLGYCRTTRRECLVWIPQTEKDQTRMAFRVYLGVETSLMDERVVGIGIIPCKHLFQMRPGRRKPAGKQQISTSGGMAENEPSGIAVLTAQPQKILVQALRQI